MKSGCSVEKWTIEALAKSLLNHKHGDKKIVVPMFQRGARWNKEQEKTFIDSVIRGFPVGTMLFYKRIENNKEVYIIVDGLQRGNTIKKYMTNRAKLYLDGGISSEACSNIAIEINVDNSEYNIAKIKKHIEDFIREEDLTKNLQYYRLARKISDEFKLSQTYIDKIINCVGEIFEDKEKLFNEIAKTEIPVVVYEGAEENLPEIFSRINSKGTPLDRYEIYAAAWPVKERFPIKNEKVIAKVIKKYDTLANDGYMIDGYNKMQLQDKKEVNAFEYLFGLSKYLVEKYEILAFDKSQKDDEVNSLAFELVNACLNDSDKISTLYKNISKINVDEFEEALIKTIDYVEKNISLIINFKANQRKRVKIYHSKFQILSMISTTFKEMYEADLSVKELWSETRKILDENLKKYYIFDIITNYWGEGGTSKIHKAAKPNRYKTSITDRVWNTALDGYFANSMSRHESKQVPNPRSGDYVLLNCIYMNTFTAMDQLSREKFDVEHIAPKKQLKDLNKSCNGEGLAISSIANLCYLPETLNRSKHDKNFYQDKKYLNKVNIEEIENKYSFTEEEDLEWMDTPYENKKDYIQLKENYEEFCEKRFEKMKQKICDFLDVRYEKIDKDYGILNENLDFKEELKPKKEVKIKHAVLKRQCMLKVSDMLNIKLSKEGGVYKTNDKKYGFICLTAKAQKRNNYDLYWYAHRIKKAEKIKDCENKMYVLGFGDAEHVTVIPLSEIEKHLNELNNSKDEDGTIEHYHMKLVVDNNWNIKLRLPVPYMHYLDITDKLI